MIILKQISRLKPMVVLYAFRRRKAFIAPRLNDADDAHAKVISLMLKRAATRRFL